MLVSHSLGHARELVAVGWCQGAEARDRSGRVVDAWDTEAESWSVLGALTAVAVDADEDVATVHEVASMALALAIDQPRVDLRTWNEEPGRTQAEVVAAFDAALAMLPRLLARLHPRR